MFGSRFECRHATLLPRFFVSILNGSTAAAPHNSFETTVMADFLKPRFFKFPDNSATERNFPSPVLMYLTVADTEFEPICLTQGGSKIGFPPYTLRVPNSLCECLLKH